jgi:hypothetical protein
MAIMMSWLSRRKAGADTSSCVIPVADPISSMILQPVQRPPPAQPAMDAAAPPRSEADAEVG